MTSGSESQMFFACISYKRYGDEKRTGRADGLSADNREFETQGYPVIPLPVGGGRDRDKSMSGDAACGRDVTDRAAEGLPPNGSEWSIRGKMNPFHDGISFQELKHIFMVRGIHHGAVIPNS
jgi:hypothetical protein